MQEQLKLTRAYGVAEKAPSVGVKPAAPPPRGLAASGVVTRDFTSKPGQQAPDRPGTIRGMAEKIMEEHPETRNDDLRLQELLLHKYFPIKCHQCGADMLLSEDELEKRPKAESIRRRRQEIQHQSGRLLPTDLNVLYLRGFFKECALERLRDDGVLNDKPPGYAKAVCKQCGAAGTDKCRRSGDPGGLEEPHRVMVG